MLKISEFLNKIPLSELFLKFFCKMLPLAELKVFFLIFRIFLTRKNTYDFSLPFLMDRNNNFFLPFSYG